MSSTTYEHFVDTNKMFAAQEQFRNITKNGLRMLSWLHENMHLGNAPVMVRNAGQLPQPFWLGAACGGGSCSLSASVARA